AESQFFTDDVLQRRRYAGMRANCPADGSNGDRIACLLEPLAIASHLVDPHRELEPKGGGLGVHTVRASDTKGVAELNGLPLEDRRKAVNSFEQKVRGVAQLE